MVESINSGSAVRYTEVDVESVWIGLERLKNLGIATVCVVCVCVCACVVCVVGVCESCEFGEKEQRIHDNIIVPTD